ncbi:MAG: MFS transporter [Nanoarchaeota archaeon]
MKQEVNQEIAKKQKALKVSIHEGAASSLSLSIGETYITPFALALKAQPFHIGIINSFSGLISPLAQFFGSKILEKYTRKKIVLFSALIQSLLWIPIVLLAFAFWKGMFQENAIYFLLIFYSLLSALGGLLYPAWFSWMGDLVPEKERGKYFGNRTRILSAVGLIGVLIGAFVLDAFKTRGLLLFGFASLFLAASLFRFVSYIILHKQYSPQFKLKKKYYFSLLDFLKRFDNFGKFAVYQALFNFVLMIASPFFAVYMLQELNFNYITFMIVTISSTIFYLLFVPLIGKFSDKYGNRLLLHTGAFLFSINPILWIFIKSPLLLILIPQMIVGLANAALVIGHINFTYGSVSKEHRAICTAYANILIGIGVFFGSLLGGLIINYAHPSFINTFVFVFLISAIGRFAVSFIFLKILKDEKKFPSLPPQHIHLFHPFKTIHSEIGWVKHVMFSNGK